MSKGARIKKTRETALGSITRDQRRAIESMVDAEVRKQCKEADTKYWRSVTAAVLWALHVYAGWGAKKLLDFDKHFNEMHDRLREYYDIASPMNGFECEVLLKRIGVDLEKWENDDA